MAATVGEILRTIRKERGLSLEQASIVTRVRHEYLAALENNEEYLLPSAVQGRGYLRLYADYLGLPVQPLLDAWPNGIPVFPEVKTPQDEISAKEGLVEQEKPTEVEKFSKTEPFSEISPPKETTDIVGHDEQDFTESVEEEMPAGSQAIFKQIGADLRQRREGISLSIDDVEKFTRLRAHYIHALESGCVDDLPSLVQGRGMLANYAQFLDLDVEHILARFADGLQARRLELMQPKKKESRAKLSRKTVSAPGWRRFITPDLLIGGTIFTIFFILVIWGAARVNEMNRGSEQPTPPSISEVLMNTSIFETETTLLAPVEPSMTAPAASIEPVQSTSTPELSSNEGSPPPVTNAPLQLNITASQRTWMQVKVDGSVIFQGRTIPGNAYPFTGYERIELTAGNAAALNIVFNQQNLGSPGTMGEAARMIFSNEGASTPTAQFTPTRTMTSVPTNTRQPTLKPATPTITPLIP